MTWTGTTYSACLQDPGLMSDGVPTAMPARTYLFLWCADTAIDAAAAAAAALLLQRCADRDPVIPSVLSCAPLLCAVRMQRGAAERADGIQRRQQRLEQVRRVPGQLQLLRAIFGAAGALVIPQRGSGLGGESRVEFTVLGEDNPSDAAANKLYEKLTLFH